MADTRLVTPTARRRSAERRLLSLPARITWKDTSGAVRFTSVMTRDISEAGLFVDVDAAAAIPLYRLVVVQLERTVRDAEGVPAQLRDGRVLSAVWRVAPCRRTTGTPSGYALRFLVEPQETPCARSAAAKRMPVAS